MSTNLYREELKKILRKRLRGSMSASENVLYFPKDVDVRICPKNGMTSLKWALLYVNNIEISSDNPKSLIYGTKRHRMGEIKKYGDRDSLPFRKDSFRVAIARDPIKRFMSACEYIKTEYTRVNEVIDLNSGKALSHDELKALESMSDVDILPDNLDEIIDGVWNGEIQNTHFYTQTFYYSNRSQYDKIVKMKNFKEFMEWLRVRCESPKKIDRVHTNRTSGLYFGGVEKLTEDQKKRIMRIYQEDYDYGWTED